GDIPVEPRHGLRQALVGAKVLDHAGARFGRRELSVPGEARLAIAEIFKNYGRTELNWLDIVSPAMVIDNALGWNDLVIGNAVLVVAAVRAMHDEAPGPAGSKFESMRCRRESVRSPPLRQVLRVRECREHQIPRRIENACAD